MYKRLTGGYINPIKDRTGRVKANSIASMHRVRLGGVEQWVVIRGHQIDRPLLLFLHGGPGASQAGCQQKLIPQLEELFVVVHWDQRGGGKSYSRQIPPETMNVEQLLHDMKELVDYLLRTYNRSKLYLVGHSWGAYLGILFAQRYPEHLHRYIGVNQPVDRRAEEQLSYQYVLEAARRAGHKKAMAALSKVAFTEEGDYKSTKDLAEQRRWLTKFGGVTYAKSALRINLHCLLSTHLTLKDRLHFFKGFAFSAEHLWSEFSCCHLPSQIPELSVPVTFILGRYDKITHLLCEDYARQLQSPAKQVFIFEQSGHLACFEEPERFMEIMRSVVEQ